MVNIRSVSFPGFFIQIFFIVNRQTNSWDTKVLLWVHSAIIYNATSVAEGRSSHRYPPGPWPYVNHILALKISSGSFHHRLLIQTSIIGALSSAPSFNGIIWNGSDKDTTHSKKSPLGSLYMTSCFIYVADMSNTYYKTSPVNSTARLFHARLLLMSQFCIKSPLILSFPLWKMLLHHVMFCLGIHFRLFVPIFLHLSNWIIFISMLNLSCLDRATNFPLHIGLTQNLPN